MAVDAPTQLAPAIRAARLAALLTMEQVGPDRFLGSATPAENSLGRRGRVYGGLAIGQALAAAAATVAGDRPLASLHCRFLRTGDEGRRIGYQVTRDMDGGRVSHRRVVADQGDAPILTFSAMFHRPGAALDHQPIMPDVPGPEALRATFAACRRDGTLPPLLGRFLAVPRLTELVPATPELLDATGRSDTPLRVWLRLTAETRGLEALAPIMLAYASDSVMLISAGLRHGLSHYRGQMRGASVDHALWLHDRIAADEWLLFDIACPWAGNGRALTSAQVFARDGRLVASASQEGLLQRIRTD